MERFAGSLVRLQKKKLHRAVCNNFFPKTRYEETVLYTVHMVVMSEVTGQNPVKAEETALHL